MKKNHAPRVFSITEVFSRRYLLQWSALILLALACISTGLGAYSYHQRFSSDAIVTACKKAGSTKALCYTNHIKDVLTHKGLIPAFDLLAAAYKADPQYLASCHSDTHELGRAAYQIFHATGKVDLTPEASYCGFGFYHGFMEEMLVQTGSLSEARAFCSYVGKTLGGNQQYAKGSCYHGIGHGVTDGSDPTLWGDATRMAAPGLALCRKVATSDEMKMRCASGVFNAIAIMYMDPRYHLDAHNDPYAICANPSYTANEKKACYDQGNGLAFFVAHNNFARALSFTTLIAEPAYRAIAVQALAGVVYSQQTYVSMSDAVAACKKISGSYQESCIRGLVNGIMEYGTPGSEYKDALSFCASAGLSGPYKNICMNQIVVLAVGIYSPAQQGLVCKSVPLASRTLMCAQIASSTSAQS